MNKLQTFSPCPKQCRDTFKSLVGSGRRSDRESVTRVLTDHQAGRPVTGTLLRAEQLFELNISKAKEMETYPVIRFERSCGWQTVTKPTHKIPFTYHYFLEKLIANNIDKGGTWKKCSLCDNLFPKS